jgi:glucosamine--fructose-6-phosphate aminotransferase (isomerizing)
VAEKGGFKHFMLKEIHEQPGVLADTMRGRIVESTQEVNLDELGLTDADVKKVERAVFVACGTSWHAAMVGKFWMEALARIPTEVDLSSEFRYRNPVVDGKVLCVPISQSGETADTLAALEEAKKLGTRVLAVCNVVDSSIARKAHHVLYTHAGPEIGVASTKAFTTQLVSLAMVAIYFAQKRGTISKDEIRKKLHNLISLPRLVEEALAEDQKISEIASAFMQATDFLYLGRGMSHPIALEGALKLKEISYVHAEGYAGGEIKHGPIALIDEKMPVVALATGGANYAKMASNIEEVCARGGRVIAVVSKGDRRLEKQAAALIEIPEVDDFIRPVVEVVPLQLLAYYMADRRGSDVDQPRNLAKSVTVE